MKQNNIFKFDNDALNKQYKEFLAELDKKNYTYVFVQNLMIELKNGTWVALNIDFNSDIVRFEACVVMNHKAIKNIKVGDLYTAKNPTFFYANSLNEAFDELEHKYGNDNN